MEHITENVVYLIDSTVKKSLGLFLDPGHFFSVFPLFVAFVIAYFVVKHRLEKNNRPQTFVGMLKILFPARIFLHKSALNDYAILMINGAILTMLTLGSWWSIGLINNFMGQAMASIDVTDIALENNMFSAVIYTLYLVLIWDFSATFAHYLKHKVPFIWEFHKLHHSAEVMTPITALRRHPVDALFGDFITILFLGIGFGIWNNFIDPNGSFIAFFGGLAGIYLWRLLGYNLRHTHIWISYGPFWERIFISPAQHQIHHSKDAKHYDKNFGHIFSCWDYLFGTLHFAYNEKRVTFGIEDEEMEDFKTLHDLYLKPFVKIWKKSANLVKFNPQRKL